MPTQWRTIAPIVGRTATQCLERYQKLLDDAEARENDEEFGLGGPTGGEGAAPSADDVRRLRPGELDPDPESKPARPDTIDLDEDEKEMLSEARARLANTQGKKAKRKARERQLEESRRLALLQKRRELKASGINIKVGTRKKGQMDYNADIPFEKAPAPGFYDTQEEAEKNEAQRAGFDPRKQQLAIKRKGDNDDQELPGKRQKKDKDSGSSAFAAAARAGQLAKLREAEQSSKRRALVLPAPQVSDAEMDDIVKLGLLGRRMDVSEEDDESSRGLRGEYSNRIGATPIRTPRAPQEEDRILNEIRNAKARTQLQSALLGGESADIQEDNTTGYQGATPAHNNLVTPNPLATPYRQGLGPGSTPMRGPGATPMRTPRDTFRLNQDSNTGQLVSQTPRDVRLREQTLRNDLRSKLASLPKPKETEWEFELPDEQTQTPLTSELTTQEDAAVRDERERQQKHAQALLDLRRQTQVIQRGLPRPVYINDTRLLQSASKINDPVKRQVTEVAISLMLHDAENSNKNNKKRSRASIKYLSEEEQYAAKMEITLELAKEKDDVRRASMEKFGEEWDRLHSTRILPGLADYDDDDDEIDEDSLTRIEINVRVRFHINSFLYMLMSRVMQ